MSGRKTDIADYQKIEKIVDSCSENNYKTSELLAGILKCYF